ncbi:hypothetical protein C8R43DRAFT_1012814 [Mycena crocata]|nr:hypothetical protein C8R43DRAFT_1012814 [Mycena crocata]
MHSVTSVTPCPRCGKAESPLEVSDALPTSPCPELLCANDTAPPDSLRVEILSELDSAMMAISRFDDEIAELVFRRQELRDFIADHEKVLAPIRKLPGELLSQIFLHSAERDSTSVWNPITDPEWVLARVCSYWRTIALSLPQLWRHIHISDAGYPFIHPTASIESTLSLQLDRCAQVPLAISFNGRHLMEGSTIYLLRTLFSVAHRWQTASLTLTASDVLEVERQSYATSFPALRSLALSGNEDEQFAFTTVLKSVPVLEELCYNGGGHSYCTRSLFGCANLNLTFCSDAPDHSTLERIHNFPFAQLSNLSLHNNWHETWDILNILHLASRLVDLSFHSLYRRDHPFIHHNQEILPNLHSLTLVASDLTFLHHIDVPALRVLNITQPLSTSINPPMDTSIASFLIRTAPSLTHLTLDSVGENLLDILGSKPHLTTLILSRMEFCLDFTLVRALTCGPGERNLVPHVVSLDLSKNHVRCPTPPLLDMLRSRCDPGSLRFIALPQKLNHLITTLCDEGLDINQ